MIAVIDYCKGNLKSVERGLTHVGGDAHITDDPEVIRTADALVLPGVGSFADAPRPCNKRVRWKRSALPLPKELLF